MKRFFYIFILFASCKDVYNPPLKNAAINYLVVEGNIVTGNDSTIIHLSRTIPVADTSVVQPETNATVTVESDNGDSYPLQNENNGSYSSAPLNINTAKNYRLHIFTADGKEYASDFVSVQETPPIDSVSWVFNASNGVDISVNTHDATGNTQYYRWNYVETWEHRAHDYASLIYDPASNTVRDRLPEEQDYRCWNINTSGNIFIASTTGLSSDIIFKKPLVNISYQSDKLLWEYSIIVTQYALTKEAYEYWDNLKKNTEELGSIFDPQPFAEFGNIHCITNANEPVLGFISACSTSQQRIYINSTQIGWSRAYPNCKDTLITGPVGNLFSSMQYSPVRIEPYKGIHADFPECVDCRLTGGGITIKPPYMP